MYFRIIHVSVLVLSILGNALSDKNATHETKSKRGIQDIGNAGEFSVLPVQHVGTYTQVRSLNPDETPLVDITYKSLENGYQNQYVPLPSQPPKTSSDNSYEAQTYHPQQFNYESLLQKPQQYFQSQQQLPVYGSPISAPQQLSTSSYLSSAYPLTLNNKLPSAVSFASQKSIHFPAGLKKNNPLGLHSYANPVSTLPSIYGAAHDSSSLKYLQSPNLQYSLPYQSHSYPQAIKLEQPYNIKAPYKLQSSLLQNRPSQLQQSQVTSSPLYQISQNYKSLEPSFYGPQVFDNPIVPQLQHFLPSSQSPFDTFTKPIQPATPGKNTVFTPSPQIKSQDSQQNKDDENDEEDDDDDEGVNRKVKGEIKGEICHHEVNDEDDFNKGYHNSARGFPTYDHSDHDEDDDEYVKPDYHHDDRNGKYESYKTSSRYSDNDHDDHSDVDSHRDYSRRPHDYDEESRSRHHGDHDAEGHYSNKHQKKEPRAQNHKSHQESYKYQTKGESEHHYKKPHKQYEKKYKSIKPSSYRSQSDSKYASDTVKSHNVKAPSRAHTKTTTPTAKTGKSLTEPNYQYGFEPIKTPYATNTKQSGDDQEGKYSSNKPIVKSKIHRDNYYLSKSRGV